MNGLGHQPQHAARALKSLQGAPARIELIEEFRMDGVSFLKFAPVIFIGRAARKLVFVFPIELGELLQRVVPVVKLVAGNVLEQPPPDDFVALFLRCRPPGRLDPGEGLDPADESGDVLR